MKIKITIIESGIVNYGTDDVELAKRWAEEDFEEANVLVSPDSIGDYDCEVKYEQV
jgi:hypothetical protein